MDILLLVWSAVNRISTSGQVIGEEERITPLEALRAVTIDGAWQIFQEDNRGSLEVGKYADLVILSADPTKDPVGIKDINELETIVGGTIASSTVESCGTGTKPIVPELLVPVMHRQALDLTLIRQLSFFLLRDQKPRLPMVCPF